MSDALGVPLVEVDDRGGAVARYVRATVGTLRLVAARRPKVLFVQNPSVVLGVLLSFVRKVVGTRIFLAVDAHNEAVEPYVNPGWFFRCLYRFVLRSADVTIVTNDALGKSVVRNGGAVVVIPDPLPELRSSECSPPTCRDPIVITVVATYAPDEPIEQILLAADRLKGFARFQFTGNVKRLAVQLRERAPDNVDFLGFLSDEAYWAQLHSSHAVLDLTLMPRCIVCGAYEATAVGRPLLLSDNGAGRDLFAASAVFVEAKASDIVDGVQDIQARYSELLAGCDVSRSRVNDAWNKGSAELMSLIAERCGRSVFVTGVTAVGE